MQIYFKKRPGLVTLLDPASATKHGCNLNNILDISTRSHPYLKIFDIPDLIKIVKEAGFEQFEPLPYGCLLMFTMQKK
jgi:hypothetical protein